MRLGFSLCGAGISFHAIVGFGAKERAAELGADLSIVSVFTPEQQAASIQRFADEQVDVLIVDALESEIVLPALLEAAAAGIPLIAADGSIHGVEAACSVHSANVAGGELAAGFLVAQLRGRGTIAHLSGLMASDNGLERSRGFHNVVDTYREIEIAEASGEWTRESGAAAMRELLAVHPAIDAVFAVNDAQALGALDVIREAGRAADVVTVGFDGMPDALLAIAQGAMTATVRQMPREMGRLAVELALRVHRGEEVPTVVETDVALVTSANVAEASLEALPLFPPILLDLAERSAALAEERTRLRTLIDNLPDLIYVKDADSRFLVVNEATAAHFGTATRDEAVGKSDFDFFPHAYASQYRADEEEVLSSGEPLINHEELTPDAEGTTRWLSTTKVPMRNESGGVVGLVGMSRDITRQKEAEAERGRLMEEQAALRRVATLVAAGIGPAKLFSAVSEEVARLFKADSAAVARFAPDRSAIVVVGRSHGLSGIPVGTQAALGEWPFLTDVIRTGRAARWSDEFYSSVAAPITVGGSLWGVLTASSGRRGLPIDTEERLEKFGELVATAIANAQSRTELAGSEKRARELANEQAALRRVATRVAQGASPDEVFTAVADEVAGIIDIPVVGVNRYESDGTFTIVGIVGANHFTVGSRWQVEEAGIAGMILATGRPSRWDDYPTMPGRLGEAVREELLGSTVGVPIVVEGSIWGFMVAAAKPGQPIPADTESRLARFTELVATAVSNATARTDLLTSRARLVSTADETRRRLERDLHDGIQQWLVTLALRARTAAGHAAQGESPAQELSALADDLVAVTEELREISRGIHPAILSEAGLDDALAALARRSAIRVDLDVSFQARFDPPVESTVYYVVAELITNAAKHSQASRIAVRGGLLGDSLELAVEDDGIGGADPVRGTGLLGLKDRIDTLGGTISLVSSPGGGTKVRVNLPISSQEADHPRPRETTDAAASPSG